MAEKPEFTADRQQMFAVWAFDRHPEWVDEWEGAIRFTLTELDTAIAQAQAERERLLGVLGVPVLGDAEEAAPAKAEPKKRAPRKTRAEKIEEHVDPAPEVETIADKVEVPEEVFQAEPGEFDVVIVNGDPVAKAAPEADDDSDFEDFEIPADDEDDEF